MNSRTVIRAAAERFRTSGIPDPEVDAALLLSHVTGRAPLSLRLDTDFAPDEEQLAAFSSLCEQRLRRRPLQYLLGTQCFYGRDFLVDERVLIPRPETELLAERAIQALRTIPAPAKALDLCCGSGCIAVTLALEVPCCRVHAADLSPDALDVTARNAQALGAHLTLHQGDLWAALPAERYHVIVSNPPYIPTEDCAALQAEVQAEPRLALDGGEDGLTFYRRIASGAEAHLHPGGKVLLEVGHDQADAVCSLLLQAGFHQVESHRDLNNIPRIVEAIYPGASQEHES